MYSLKTQFKFDNSGNPWMEKVNGDSRFGQIIKLLSVLKGDESLAMSLNSIANSKFFINLQQQLNATQKLVFILPAFPAKSPNPKKTSGVMPDLGEILGLQKLHEFIENLKRIYPYGAEMIICSDGRVFNDLVLVSDESLKQYQLKISEIIEKYSLYNLKIFNLDQCFDQESYPQMRQYLVENFGTSLEQIMNEMKSNEVMEKLFNGIHRFIKEDRLELNVFKSKNQICAESKLISYQVIQRSRSWDKLLEVYFPHGIRLSIHPYPLEHHKFGVSLVPGFHRWATPWHNVVVKKNSQYWLMKREEALSLGAVEKMFDQEFLYYEI